MHKDSLFATVSCTHCGAQITVPVYCGNRFCDVCTKARRFVIRYKLSKFAETRTYIKGIGFKMVTLTIKSQPDLKEMVVYLVKSFRQLRQRKSWSNVVLGGAFVLEIKKNEHGWHAHIHAIIESPYIPWQVLSKDWSAITGSTGIQIKAVPMQRIVQYLTKYLTKNELPEELQEQASTALKGMRLFQPFGHWHGPINAIKPLKHPCKVCDAYSWEFGTMDMIYNCADVVHDMPKRPPIDSASDKSHIPVIQDELPF